jgi:hypothetical protein
MMLPAWGRGFREMVDWCWKTRRGNTGGPYRCPYCLTDGSVLVNGRLTQLDGQWSGKAEMVCRNEECGKVFVWRG